ncbi:MAG: 1-deoxy-D-xylulose-5-phosphate synthase [Pseudomonadota bacterium]|nr:1-deoxy-D-xylulose-5-phosphate synthase [Pseudomonadota bacterium]
MRNTFIRTLMDLAGQDDRIFLVTADMGYSVLEGFRGAYPERFLNAGIAEQNAVGVAAGLALSGYQVYVYSIIPFVTMRCFEQVRVDVAYQNLDIKLVGVGAGYSYGPAGATHHAIEDIAIMRSLPNMRVVCPGDPVEVKELVLRLHESAGPAYLRLGKNGEPSIHPEGTRIELGQAMTIRSGHDLAVIATSNMLEQALKWTGEWEQEGISVRLVSMPTIKPLDRVAIVEMIEEGLPILTLEEHSRIGGLGSAVAEVIADEGKPVRFKRIGIQDEFSHHVGSQQYVRGKMGLMNKPDWPLKHKP